MKWQIRKPFVLDVAAFRNKTGVSDRLAKILLNRGITTEDANAMLKEPLLHIQDIGRIYGCVDAAQVLVRYIREEGTHFYVYADYDVDGLMSGTIMREYLSRYRPTTVHFPEREEGYGLSQAWCDGLIRNVRETGEKAVVITVDNGITKHVEVGSLTDNGIPVIVTDHHEPVDGEPPALVVCDPKLSLEADTENEKSLCGAGVAFFVCATVDDILKDDPEGSRIRSFLPYVAVATVADVMDMTKGNSCLVNAGLSMVNREKKDRIAQMMDTLSIPFPLTAEEIGWEIGPRLNACGRMGSTWLGAQYLQDGADETAFAIDQLNKKRKDLQKELLGIAQEQDYSGHYACLYVLPDDVESGVGGAVAGQLADRYQRPAIVLHHTEKGLSGSTRSFAQIDLLSILLRAKDAGIIDNAGGHAAASGIGMKEQNLDALQVFLDREIAKLPTEVTTPLDEALCLDGEISLGDVCQEVYEDINQIPYDKACIPQPVFLLPAAEVIGTHYSSNNPDNVELTLQDRNGNVLSCWAWRMGDTYKRLGSPRFIHVACRIKMGTFGRDNGRVILSVEDIQDAGIGGIA